MMQYESYPSPDIFDDDGDISIKFGFVDIGLSDQIKLKDIIMNALESLTDHEKLKLVHNFKQIIKDIEEYE